MVDIIMKRNTRVGGMEVEGRDVSNRKGERKGPAEEVREQQTFEGFGCLLNA